jgi:hypothetical protein
MPQRRRKRKKKSSLGCLLTLLASLLILAGFGYGSYVYVDHLASTRYSYSTQLASNPAELPVPTDENTGNQPVDIEGQIPILATVTADDYLNVRSCPSKVLCPIALGWLGRGEKVAVYECSEGWARIGANAWVFSTYLEPNYCEEK